MTIEDQPNNVTQLSDVQASGSLSQFALGQQADPVALRQAEQAVAFEWKPGDVILDLYEVRSVTEGFGEDRHEKDFHEGGFGRVYRVWHRTWQREMAVKTPRVGAFTTQQQKDAFIQECETWVNLGLHPHIAACHYVRELGGAPRVFSEYAEAGTLEEWITSRRLYEGVANTVLARMLDTAIQFAWGLHYAHERGVVHQDVKPLNALMWEDGTLKVCDFGLSGARQKDGRNFSTPVGTPDGRKQTLIVPRMGGMSPAYCSPEQAVGKRELDRRTDVWSWAVSVLEMFLGQVSWTSGSVADSALEDYLEQEGESGIPKMPEALVWLLRQCLQQEPDERSQTMRACIKVLCTVYRVEIGKPYSRPEPQAVSDTADALNNRALSLLDLGKAEEAERQFNQALEQDRHHLGAIYNLGLLRWRSGRCTDVDLLVSLQEIQQSRPNDGSVECALGSVRLESADFVHAQSHFERAMELGEEREPRRLLELTRSFNPTGTMQCLCTIEGIFMAVSPDGRFAISGSTGSDKFTDFTLRLWEIATKRCLSILEEHTMWGTSVAFSPDVRFALSASADRTLRLWDVGTGQCLRTFQEHATSVNAAVFSPDSRFILSGSDDGTVNLWNVATGQCVRTFKGHTNGIKSVALSPDGRFALSGSCQVDDSNDDTLKLWDLATGQCLRSFEGQKRTVASLAFSPDSRLALTGMDDTRYARFEMFRPHTFARQPVSESESVPSLLALWDVATGKRICTFQGEISAVTSVAFSSDSRFILSGNSTTLRLRDVATGQCLRTYENAVATNIAFSPDGNEAFSYGDKSLQLWDVARAMSRSYRSPWHYSMIATAVEALDHEQVHLNLLSHARNALDAHRVSDALQLLEQARKVPGFAKSPTCLELLSYAGARSQIKSYGDGWLKHIFEGHTTRVTSVAFSPDGRFALSGSADKSIRLWNATSRECLHTFEGHVDAVHSVVFSPDGRFILSGSADKSLRLWDVSSGQWVRTFEGQIDSVNSVALSPDGRFCLSLSEGSRLQLWDISTGQCAHTFVGHEKVDASLAFSPDGRFAICAGPNHLLILLDIAMGYSVRTFRGHELPITCGKFSPDGRLVLSGSHDETLKLWDISTGQCLVTFNGHTNTVNAVAFSPDGRFALSGSEDKTIKLWEVSTGLCLRTLEGNACEITSIAISPDGRFALAGRKKHQSPFLPYSRGNRRLRIDLLELWELSTGKFQRAFDVDKETVTSVAFSPDGRFVLSGGEEATLCLWDVAKRRCLRKFEGHDAKISFVAFSSDGKHVFSSGSDSLLCEWNITTGGCRRIPRGHRGTVTSVAFSPDGRFALSGSEDKTIKLWEVSTGLCLRTMEGHDSSVQSVAFSNDGCLAVSAGQIDKTVRLWAVASGQCLRIMKRHSTWVGVMASTSDGCFALSGSNNNSLRSWEVATEQRLRTFEGHNNPVECVAFSPDVRFALSASADRTLRLWDVGTGQCLRTFQEHATSVNAAVFSPDSRFILSGSDDGTVKLWELDWEYEYDPEYDPVLKRRTEDEKISRQQTQAGLYLKGAEEARRWVAEQRHEREEGRLTTEEAWNRSLLGRVSNFFTGKGRKK